MDFARAPIAVLDACVLYPAPVRDLLLHLAAVDLFQPKWTETIQEEWSRNLLMKRPDLNASQLKGTIKQMNRAFPDANVTGFEDKIDKIQLPDLNDRHVLAAAIQCKSALLITFNLKDFPKSRLKKYSIEPRHPDAFVLDLLDLHPEKVVAALHNQVKCLRNPPKTEHQVLETLKRCGLSKSCEWLEMAFEMATMSK